MSGAWDFDGKSSGHSPSKLNADVGGRAFVGGMLTARRGPGVRRIFALGKTRTFWVRRLILAMVRSMETFAISLDESAAGAFRQGEGGKASPRHRCFKPRQFCAKLIAITFDQPSKAFKKNGFRGVPELAQLRGDGLPDRQRGRMVIERFGAKMKPGSVARSGAGEHTPMAPDAARARVASRDQPPNGHRAYIFGG